MAPLPGRWAPRPAAWALALLIVGSLLVGCLSDPSTRLTARRGDLAEIELVVADDEGNVLIPADAGAQAAELCGQPLAELGGDGCPSARASYVLLADPPAHLPEGFTNATGIPEALVAALEGLAEGEHHHAEDLQVWGPHREELLREHDRRASLERVVEEPEAYGHTWNVTERGDGTYEIQPREDDLGAELEAPQWCNERFCLFGSELVDWNTTHLFVEHGAEEGQQVHVRSLDTFLTIVDADGESFTVDGNDPRAGESYEVYARVVDLRGPSEGEQRAPSFNLTQLGGGHVTLEEQLGQPVVLEFFATWCPSCRENAEHLVEVSERFGEEVNIVSIGVDPWESPESLRSFIDEHGVTWPVAVDEQGEVANDYGVGTLSTELVVDAHGVIRHVETGVADHDRVVSILQTLLDDPGEGGDVQR